MDNSLREISAQYIKGVGPQRFKDLQRLGINSIYDLLYFFPRRYEDRREFKKISHLQEGSAELVMGEIFYVDLRQTRRRLHILEIRIKDGSGVLSAVWFNQPYLRKIFKEGKRVILYGKVERFLNLQMNSPEFEIVDEGKQDSLNMGRIVPVYALSGKLTQRILRTIIHETVKRYAYKLCEFIPYDIRKRNDLPNIVEAINWMHFPADFEKKEQARRRFVFEEFFLLQLGVGMKRIKEKIFKTGIRHQVSPEFFNLFMARLPFKLTESQIRVIKEIEADMAKPKPMQRLLQGEVGSGKTVIACYALLLTVNNGYQGALMAPTEILAEQHFVNLSNFLVPFGVKVGLLVSGTSPRMRQTIKEELREGEIEIIVGTHSLIEEDVVFKNLGLVVIDEQHKFGVWQRKSLQDKGLNPDCLIMTATPIPRTLALTLYGDLDISTLYELPKGRGKVFTYWVSEEKRNEVYDFIKEEIRKGRQAFIVYPLIEESEVLDVKSATQMYEELKERVFGEFRIGLLHGRLSSEEKNRVMQDFKEKRIDVLVSTLVIEVGIDIPNVTVIVVENAERFGLAQLHQLRGRIGRGKFPSYCILFSSAKTEEARQRLTALVRIQDGFKIAEEDLKIRGPGDFFGARQHGFPEIKMGDILKDMQILELSRKEAFSLLQYDPELKSPQHKIIWENLKERFPQLELLSVG
ncbi:MAG: ATP-dependent DNA helicase RecG [Candidatus Omnitrophica bacterium]|nr:ATP-dependent DNA helicase RecG [Candidatus Omnitrophota bacterium]MCM8797892.1 ATP-dependent DNA helicase RecG [Candidatus Omnitrophota bacterium]